MKFIFTPKITFAKTILNYIILRAIINVKNMLNRSINKPWKSSDTKYAAHRISTFLRRH